MQLHSGAQHLIEVKPSAKLARPDVQRKLSVARQFAERQGWSFHVVTERELTVGPLLNNVRLLNRFRCVSVPVEMTRRAQELVAGQPRSWLDLAQRLSAHAPDRHRQNLAAAFGGYGTTRHRSARRTDHRRHAALPRRNHCMGSIRLGVGTEWLLDGRSFRIVRQLGPHEFIAEDLKFRLERAFSESELLAAFAGGHLRFLAAAERSAEDTAAPPKRSVAPASQEPGHRKQALAGDRTADPFGTHSPCRVILPNVGRNSNGMGVATRRGRCSDGSIVGEDRARIVAACRPASSRCGGRGKSRSQGWLRRFPLLRELVERAIQEVYLTTARRPMSAVVRRVLEDLQRHNSRTSAAQALPVPKPGSLARTIARRIRQLDPYEIDRARWGHRIADQRHQATTRQQLATRSLGTSRDRSLAAQGRRGN